MIIYNKNRLLRRNGPRGGQKLAVPLSFITLYQVDRSRTHFHSTPLPVLPPDVTALSVGSFSATLSDQCGFIQNILPPGQVLCQVPLQPILFSLKCWFMHIGKPFVETTGKGFLPSELSLFQPDKMKFIESLYFSQLHKHQPAFLQLRFLTKVQKKSLLHWSRPRYEKVPAGQFPSQ